MTMTANEFRDRLVSALQPVLEEAERDGYLVGGTLNLCVRDVDSNGTARCEWRRYARLTIARKNTECISIELVARPKPPRDPEPQQAMAPDQAEAIAHAFPGEVYTGDVCQSCSSPRVVRRGGCAVCLKCGENVGGCG